MSIDKKNKLEICPCCKHITDTVELIQNKGFCAMCGAEYREITGEAPGKDE